MGLDDGGTLPEFRCAEAGDGAGDEPAARQGTRRQTLEYVGDLIRELRGLAEETGSERLATLLALAQYEVRSLLGKGPIRGP